MINAKCRAEEALHLAFIIASLQKKRPSPGEARAWGVDREF